MALINFGYINIQTWDGSPFPELENSPLPFSQGTVATGIGTVALNFGTAGLAGVLVVPEESVAKELTTGVTGVLTSLTFAPLEPVEGSPVTIEERVGTFAYLQALDAALVKLNKDFSAAEKKDSALSQAQSEIVNEAEQLITGGDIAANIRTQLVSDAGILSAGKLNSLAKDTTALATIAGEWSSPEFFLAKGSAALKQVKVDPANGIGLLKVNRSEATFKINSKIGPPGIVVASGFTAETDFETQDVDGHKTSNAVYNVLDADQNGEIDAVLAPKTSRAADVASAGLLINYMAATAPAAPYHDVSTAHAEYQSGEPSFLSLPQR